MSEFNFEKQIQNHVKTHKFFISSREYETSVLITLITILFQTNSFENSTSYTKAYRFLYYIVIDLEDKIFCRNSLD